jgi:hypothetical protein
VARASVHGAAVSMRLGAGHPVGVVTYVTAVVGDGGGRREPAAGCGQRAMHGGDF